MVWVVVLVVVVVWVIVVVVVWDVVVVGGVLMAVVGEMHVGKGREEKEKRKGRGRQLVRVRVRPRRRDAHGSCILHATLSCVARVTCARGRALARAGSQLTRVLGFPRASLSHQEVLPLGAHRTKRQCVLLP